jgi:hypothetical protein
LNPVCVDLRSLAATNNMNIELQSMAIELPRLDHHPNRTPFRGVLTLVDVPSDKPPAGARGHCVLLTREAAERALASLLGMGLDYAPALDRHDARRKVGLITEANIVRLAAVPGLKPRGPDERLPRPEGRSFHHAEGSAAIEISGFLYARDFPELIRQLRGGPPLGMSYEVTDAHVANLHAHVWTITEFTFTGAALLRREKAAYRSTWIELTN